MVNDKIKIDVQNLVSFILLTVAALSGFFSLKTDVELIKKDIDYIKHNVEIIEFIKSSDNIIQKNHHIWGSK